MAGQLNIRTVKLGDSATPANNFLITTPAVADGTLTIKRENGTEVMTIDAAGGTTFLGGFAGFTYALGTKGHIKFPSWCFGGLIVNWGSLSVTTLAANSIVYKAEPFSTPFTTTIYNIQASAKNYPQTNQVLSAHIGNPELTDMSVGGVSSISASAFSISYLAIGK